MCLPAPPKFAGGGDFLATLQQSSHIPHVVSHTPNLTPPAVDGCDSTLAFAEDDCEEQDSAAWKGHIMVLAGTLCGWHPEVAPGGLQAA